MPKLKRRKKRQNSIQGEEEWSYQSAFMSWYFHAIYSDEGDEWSSLLILPLHRKGELSVHKIFIRCSPAFLPFCTKFIIYYCFAMSPV
jgi:hypothetical protein